MKKQSFTTLFPDAENIHLIKDVGQIPYFMFKNFGYDSTLVTYKNSTSYFFNDKETKGLNIHFLENRNFRYIFDLTVVKYLYQNAQKIDILHLFHFSLNTFLNTLVYKLMNPKGKIYIKLDFNLKEFEGKNNKLFFFNSNFKNLIGGVLEKILIKLSTVLSVETHDSKEKLSIIYPALKEKLIYIPNGIDSEYINNNVSIKKFHDKENIIITVGRLGTTQKNTEFFLHALSKIDLKNWKVFMIGSIEKKLYKSLNTFFLENPHLKDKVFFTGDISNRLELYEWYNRAKIFCLTSKWEGFPLVFVEALYFGNFILSTDVSGANDITKNMSLGLVTSIEDNNLYASALQNSINLNYPSENLYDAIRLHSLSNYTWTSIIKQLHITLISS